MGVPHLPPPELISEVAFPQIRLEELFSEVVVGMNGTSIMNGFSVFCIFSSFLVFLGGSKENPFSQNIAR